ncbi:hypothetical protein [Actinoplanes aureus]|uniref:Uncharacterized protein n=1 Tax=Actinoplanes aureus TaxID=2792083 RepID=A0A931CJZ8_9ACTN|nr:hypothetical protein [Actinoplanes aureus]MBG0568476.1 hypothetical protein [Actinoplanes aureus]
MRKTLGWWLVVTHAVVALVAVILFVVVRREFTAVADGPEDGVLMLPVLIPLLFLSLPWSLPALTDPAVDFSEGWLVMATVVNVAIHGLIFWGWQRVRRLRAG